MASDLPQLELPMAGFCQGTPEVSKPHREEIMSHHFLHPKVSEIIYGTVSITDAVYISKKTISNPSSSFNVIEAEAAFRTVLHCFLCQKMSTCRETDKSLSL
jgi:hypothetical protein